MIEYTENDTSIKIFNCDNLEQHSSAQITRVANMEAFNKADIRIMPDVHAGKVVPIGFTAKVLKSNPIMPITVGNDIGCGMITAKLKIKRRIDLQKLDKIVHATSLGKKHSEIETEFIPEGINCDRAKNTFGTLGHGNHFIELDKDEEDNYYLTIHSGSRTLGSMVSDKYMKLAQEDSLNYNLPYEESILISDELKSKYIKDVSITSCFAYKSRESICKTICKEMKWSIEELYNSVHNCVEEQLEYYIFRKGASASNLGDDIIIPINSRDGIIIGKGKGNKDWNYSAPHGSGRLYPRSVVASKFTLSQYKKEMEGIYSSAISKETLDEAPFAYRSIDMIKDSIIDTVDIQKILKPVYNYKAGKLK